MTDMAGPWKCVSCRKMAKASAEYCAHCGKHWSKVWDNAPAEDNGTAWNYTRNGRSPRARRQRQDRSQWPEAPPRSPSRRQRRCQGQIQERCPYWCSTWQVGWAFVGLTTTAGRSGLGSSKCSCCPSTCTTNSPFDCGEFTDEDIDDRPQKVSTELPPEISGGYARSTTGRQQAADKAAAFSSIAAWKCQKVFGRALQCPCNSPPIVEWFLGGCHHSLAALCRGICSTGQRPRDSDREGKGISEVLQIELPRPAEVGGRSQAGHHGGDLGRGGPTDPSKVDVHMSQMQESLKALKGNMEEELRVSKRQRTDAMGAAPLEDSASCGQGGK